MAGGDIKVKIGAQVDSGSFASAGAAVKQFGREVKDFSRAGSIAVSALSVKFSGELTSGIGGAFRILQELGRAGIWGAIAAGFNTAFDFVAAKLKETKERAAEFRDLLRKDFVAAADAVAAKFNSVFGALGKERAATAAGLKAGNAAVDFNSASAQEDVTAKELAALAAARTDSEKRIISANAAYERGVLAAKAQLDKAKNAEQAAVKNIETAAAERAAAEAAVEQAAKAHSDAEDRLAGMYEKISRIQTDIGVYNAMKEGGQMGYATFHRAEQRMRLEIEQIKKSREADIEMEKKLAANERAAREKLAAADAALAAAQEAHESAANAALLADKKLANTTDALAAARQEAENAAAKAAEEDRKAAQEKERRAQEAADLAALRDSEREQRAEAGTLRSLLGHSNALVANDRISALGGFSSAAAASLSGVSALSPEGQELRRLVELEQGIKDVLQRIDDNTRKRVAFG